MSRPWPVLVLAVSHALASADPLAEIPASWTGRLAPIPMQRLDELDVAHIERIRDTRGRLNQMLQTGETPGKTLAGEYGRLGMLYAAHRLYAGAELALDNAAALDPVAPRWVYYAAHIALEQGEPEQALTALTRSTRIDPGYPALPLRRGQALLALNRLDEARSAYRQALDRPGLRTAALYGLGQIDLLRRDWQAAADRLDEVVARQPAANAARYPLSQALIRLGRRDEARVHLAHRGVIKPTFEDRLIGELHSLQIGARFQFERGVDAVKRRDFEAAAEAFAAGLADEPDNARARTSYARALWLSGQTDAARAELARAIADAPDATLPRFLLATIRDAEDDPVAAKNGYLGVLKLDPGHQGALSYVANLAMRQRDYVEAATNFERAIASGVTQRPLFMHYWSALASAGAPQTRLRDKLIELDGRFPEPPVFRFLLARLLAGSDDTGVRDTARAVAIARKLHQENPMPPHTELLASALAADGDFETAATLQQGLVDMAKMAGAWMYAAMLEQTLAMYRDRKLPETPWSANVPDAAPNAPDPDTAMQNYPAGQPY